MPNRAAALAIGGIDSSKNSKGAAGPHFVIEKEARAAEVTAVQEVNHFHRNAPGPEFLCCMKK